MTRPMPGPPEYWWYCTPPHGEPGLWTSDMDPAEYMPFTHLQHKRLTDAECAAHRWQAASTLGLALYAPAEVLGVDAPSDGHMYSWERPAAEPLNRAYDTWHRFATRPHALEES